MRAMLFTKVGEALQWTEVARPKVGPHQILVRVHTCALCRTDLHIIHGELKEPKLPLILGHQIVGTIEELGSHVTQWQPHTRVGIPWLQKTCKQCDYCKTGNENLCEHALFTGYHIDGGFAEYTVVEADAAFPIPSQYDDLHAAPLLCAGLIGYRAYKKLSHAKKIGLYGFGSSAHILTQIITHQGGEVYAFTHKKDSKSQEFAKKLGAVWAGDSSMQPPTLLDGAIIFAPVGALVIKALQAIKKGGAVVCAGIYMSDIPSFPYQLLWQERQIASVANLTHKDGEEFFHLASQFPIETNITAYPLENANQALHDLQTGNLCGSIVLFTHF